MKVNLFLVLLLIISAQLLYGLSICKSPEPGEIYSQWQERLELAGRDSITVRFVIQSEARKMLRKDDSDAQYYGLKGLILAQADTLETNPLSRQIAQRYPASEAAFHIASEDFFEQIYPYWNDDHEKVIIIEELLRKYPQTTWRRTMYQYLCSSLHRIDDNDLLLLYLEKWREEFPTDYLPWFSSARYAHSIEADSTQYFAHKAWDLSHDPQKVNYYPREEWLLEKRSAKIISGYIYGIILMDSNQNALAEEILNSALQENILSVNDEITTCRLHYALAKLALKQGDNLKAAEQAAQALIEGDSRNYYTPLAEKILIEAASIDTIRSSTLNFCRNYANYDDVTFTDITVKAGLENVSGNRIAWGDYDNDGYDDFLLSGAGKLYHNVKGKKFEDVTEDLFNQEVKFGGALWGDLDNDGDLDIITKDPELVWLNIDYKFRLNQKESDFKDNGVSTEGMALGDINRDGNLDVYLANYEKNGSYFQDQLLIGTGDGSFNDRTEEFNALPEDLVNRAGRGVNMSDYNNDGFTDIYVSNYRLNRNYLFENRQANFLREKADILNIEGDQIDNWFGHTIGSEWGDFDNDGDLDLICANLAHPRYIDFSNRTMLYENQGLPDFNFINIREQANIRYEETHSEPCWGDVNNDGYLDLYLTSVYEGRRSFLYLNNGDKTFREVTWLSGTRHFNGWGAAFSDFDNDGDLDLIVAGGDIQIFRNDTVNENNWLEINAVPIAGCDAIGTRLTLYGRNWIQIREIQGGKGTTNQHSLIQHFGLGSHKSGIKIRVDFPSGISRTATVKDVNYRYIIEEGL